MFVGFRLLVSCIGWRMKRGVEATEDVIWQMTTEKVIREQAFKCQLSCAPSGARPSSSARPCRPNVLERTLDKRRTLKTVSVGFKTEERTRQATRYKSTNMAANVLERAEQTT